MSWKTIIWIISSVVVLTMTAAITSYFANKKSKYKNENEVQISERLILRPSKIHFYVGLMVIIYPIGIALYLTFKDHNDSLLEVVVGILGLCLISLINIYLLFYYFNYKIILYEDHFVYQNFWRHKRTLNYKDIKIDNMKMYTTIQIKNKKGKFRNLFKLTPYLDNSFAFMDYYRSAKKKKNKN